MYRSVAMATKSMSEGQEYLNPSNDIGLGNSAFHEQLAEKIHQTDGCTAEEARVQIKAFEDAFRSM